MWTCVLDGARGWLHWADPLSPPPMEKDPEITRAIEEGLELFNRQSFFEAHEVWEEQWSESQEDERHLLQGLIQVAAGFYKLQVGVPAGTAKLLEKAQGHLSVVPADYYDLNLEGLLAEIERWSTIARTMIEETSTYFDAATLPRLERKAIH